MLREEELKYLKKIPQNKKVNFFPYDSKTTQLVDNIIKKIKIKILDLEIKFIGASALKISGQGDFDIYVLCQREKFKHYVTKLIDIFGKPIFQGDYIQWEFKVGSHDVELYLTDPSDETVKDQFKIFEMLTKDKKLLLKYEHLKEAAKDLPYKEYQRKKYEFYNKLLDK